MAMSMSPIFTGAERRKKLVTYGRAARLSQAHVFSEDAPEPERVRKPAGKIGSTSRESFSVYNPRDASETQQSRHESPAPRDEFDVPSDDEPTPRAIPAKKSLPISSNKSSKSGPKPVTTAASNPDDLDVFDVPTSGDERSTGQKGKGKASQPRRGITIPRPKSLSQQTKTTGTTQDVLTRSLDSNALAQSATRARPQVAHDVPKPLTTQTRMTKQNVPATSVASKKIAQAVDQKRPKPVASMAAKKPTPPSSGPKGDLDVFDVPISEEDMPLKTPARAKRPLKTRVQRPRESPMSLQSPGGEPSAESDTPVATRNRKRSASASPVATRRIDAIQKKREASVPQRSRKYPRTEDSASPGHVAGDDAPRASMDEVLDLSTKKAKRTRGRTVPFISRAPVTNAQSSPAQLQNMLVIRPMKKQATVPRPAQPSLDDDDETMYDIPDDAKTPVARGTKSAMKATMTPRQRDLFSNLLEDTSDMATPMPSISRLRLTDRKSGATIAALSRSSSDAPQSAHSRKGGLLDMLRQAAPSSDGESESSEESEEDTKVASTATALSRNVPKHAARGVAEDMDIDTEPQPSSQPTRPAVVMPEGQRLTYAKQRSYLEEANVEDAMLNWNEDLDIGTTDGQESVTGSEDDSQQVTGLSELRRKGQLHKFEAETQAMIEDISGNNQLTISGRRSAIIEFASQLADTDYVDQLLESALTSALLRAISATGDVVFDFAAANAVLFILRTKPNYAVVEQIYQFGILPTLHNLLSSTFATFDIHRIAKDRKTNMAMSARETVAEFRSLVLDTCGWAAEDVVKLSPQLMAVKVLEELAIGLRAPGNTDSIVDESMVVKVLDAASGSSQRLQGGKATAQDLVMLDTTFSALESVSLSKLDQAAWSNELLHRLADMMSGYLETRRASSFRLSIRLCMNLTNSRPKACHVFANQTFVTRLTRCIVEGFKQTIGGSGHEQTADVREDVILGLGAMINLAEFSDQARLSVIEGGDELIGALVKIFLDGSARADQASSVEESQSSVTIGYLSILLGNLCLNGRVRSKVALLLPEQKLDVLVQKIREFVIYNQRLDRYTNDFEGAEGEETLKNFTRRLMLVVERLEQVGL